MYDDKDDDYIVCEANGTWTFQSWFDECPPATGLPSREMAVLIRKIASLHFDKGAELAMASENN